MFKSNSMDWYPSSSAIAMNESSESSTAVALTMLPSTKVIVVSELIVRVYERVTGERPSAT